MRVLAAFLLFLFVAGNGFCQGAYYEDYLIPNGYVGWLRAMHKVKNAPALPVEDKRTIYKFDESGLLKTSNDLPAGSVYPRYYYYTDASKTLLPYKAKGADGMISGEGVSNEIGLHFFVGTEHQQSLWYESNCGKEKDNYGYLPQNIKRCLEDYEKKQTLSP